MTSWSHPFKKRGLRYVGGAAHGGRPFLIKPNKSELGEIFGRVLATGSAAAFSDGLAAKEQVTALLDAF